MKAKRHKRATKKAIEELLAEVNAAEAAEVEAAVEEEPIIVEAEIHAGAEQHVVQEAEPSAAKETVSESQAQTQTQTVSDDQAQQTPDHVGKSEVQEEGQTPAEPCLRRCKSCPSHKFSKKQVP